MRGCSKSGYYEGAQRPFVRATSSRWYHHEDTTFRVTSRTRSRYGNTMMVFYHTAFSDCANAFNSRRETDTFILMLECPRSDHV
jgi:hypothetical protein